MLIRIIFGVVLGMLSETFVDEKAWYAFAISVVFIIIFTVDSASYGTVYGMMALAEFAAGYQFAVWFRTFKQKHGW